MARGGKTKLWVGIGVIAGATVAAPAIAQAGEEADAFEYGDAFRGEFDRALELIFKGEGGEGGLGISKMKPTVTAPALTSEQITKALPGNSLLVKYHHALHFKPNGKVGGYTVKLKKADDVNVCPKVEVLNDDFFMHGGMCITRTNLDWSGAWKVEDDMLCLNVSWDQGVMDDCFHVAFLLDRVALFNSGGDILYKGHTLAKGYQKDEM